METQLHVRRASLALGCALALLLAGCGVTAGGNGSPSSASSPPTATAAKTATASSATGAVVRLSVGGARYASLGSIVVTITNGSGVTIYAQQHNTSCSMILLQRLANGIWQPVFPCVNGFPHPTVGRVAPGSSFAVQLVPVVTGDAEGTGGVSWPAGTYRATLRYTTSQTTSFSQGIVVYSGTFAVG